MNRLPKYISIGLLLTLFLVLGGKVVESHTSKIMNTQETIEYVSSYHKPHSDRQNIVKSIHKYTRNKMLANQYADILLHESEIYSLDPWLVFSVAAKESSFIRSEKSYVGAIGIMQVMPFWKADIGSESDDLFDPHVNISYGCEILRIYLDQYGTVRKALAAYNGTKGNPKYPNAVLKIYQTEKS